jgi:predicted dehydrogenase
MHDVEITTPDVSTTSFRRMWEEYAPHLESGAACRVSGDDGKRAVEIVLAAYQSIATGRVVDLPLAAS